MPSFTDQTGRIVEIPRPPTRIISLVPSQTELLFHLGLDEKVAGITKFCVHPADWFDVKPRVGGTKTIKLDTILKLQPDLVIANKEENNREDVAFIQSFCPVWVSDINTLEDALQMIKDIGEITNTANRASVMISDIERAFASLGANRVSATHATAYLIWRDPYMAAGGNTFIHAMMKTCGFCNIFENRSRYPVVTTADLHEGCCELLLLSSEPYPFKEKHIEELQDKLPGVEIRLVDGEMFSWYGSRLLQAPAYFDMLRKTI